jgi:acyl dehydratase
VTKTTADVETLDTSDVDKHVGEEVGGGQLKEPVTVTDIRRWVQAMNYPNPQHYDEAAAAKGPFGVIVAPQSFAVCCDCGHGNVPAVVGKIEGSHVIFGGDEWWFYGPRIQPGDLIRVKRRFDGYTIADTRFAGPTMFSRGDTTYYNQRKEPICKQRSTAIRYRPDLARDRDLFSDAEEAPVFTSEQLAEFARQRQAWNDMGKSGQGPGKVNVGDGLPTRVLGPHSVASFTSEWRAFIFQVWGSHYIEGWFPGADAGFLNEMSGIDADGSDPAMMVGMESGPASGHTDIGRAKLVGMPRYYGYGSSIGAWGLDYCAYWAGNHGFVRHSSLRYRYPVFEGDVTFVNGEVAGQEFDPRLGVDLTTVRLSVTNQDGQIVAQGEADVELPRT